MNNLKLIFFALFFSCLSGCNKKPVNESNLKETINDESSNGSEQDITAVDIVLCDLTKSMVVLSANGKQIVDSTTLQRIKVDAAELYKKAAYGTKLIYLGIGNNDLPPELYNRTKTEPFGTPDQLDRIAYADSVIIPNEIRTAISKNFNPSKYRKTCITHALNNVYGHFIQYKKVPKLRLVILSDMIEDCDQSPIGYFSLESTDNIKKSDATIDTTSVGIIHNFKDIGVEIFMIYEAADLYNYLTMEGLNERWYKVLTHYGYTDNKKIYGHNSLPIELTTESE